jgi:LmbE family N-acetylglucosaminyl deacetylase
MGKSSPLQSDTERPEAQNLVMAKVVYLFISPHLDDVVLSCGGYIRRLTAAGERVVIATAITADVPVGLPLSREMKKRHNLWRLEHAPFAARCKEDKAAAALLSAQCVHFDLLDAIYRRDVDGKPLYVNKILGVSVHPDDRAHYEPILRNELQKVLTTWDGQDIRVFCPLAIGGHVDHILVRSAVESVCDSRKIIYFEDFPYVVKSGAIQLQLNLYNPI